MAPPRFTRRSAPLLAFLCAAMAHAQTAVPGGEAAGAPPDVDLPLPAGADLPGAMALPQAVQLGVAQNLDLLSERLRLQRQEKLQRGAWVSYTPTVVLDAELVRLRTPVNPGGGRTVHLHSAGIVWRTPVGTTVSAEGVMTQGLPSDTAVRQGGVVLGVSQPLLRDGWLTGAALPLREADVLTSLQQELFRQSLNALIVEIETAYWDLALAEADVVIKTRSRARAREQYEDTKENIRRGILAEADIHVVEENVVFFDLELASANENLRRARRRMTELLQLPADAQVVPTQPLEGPELTVPELAQVQSVGMALNPRIGAQRHQRELADLRARWAQNQALPNLDLNASLSLLGQDPRYTTAWQATLQDPTPEARVGLSFALPLDRTGVGALTEGARLELQRAQTGLASTERQVAFEILNGVSELETNLELLTLTGKQVELAELKLQAETDKYQSGLSTLVDVVRFQRDLDNALIRLQRVARQVRVVRVRLLAAQGDLHQRMGVGVQ